MKQDSFHVEKLRQDFPIFERQVHGKKLTYLDSAATSLKPQQVVDSLAEFYLRGSANIHRGVHLLAEEATSRYEGARQKLAQFLNAQAAEQIVYTSGTTASINLVARSFVQPRLKAGDEILITALEHHANIVPWQMVCEATGAQLVVAPVTPTGELSLAGFVDCFSPRTKFVAATWVSNAIGTILPVENIVQLCHERRIPVLIDAAQAMMHFHIDVQKLNVDFLVFSGHKMLAPNGIGVLYGKSEHLESMPPLFGGGDMVQSVSFKKTTYREPPARFEAGTTAIGEAIALGAAVDYLRCIDFSGLRNHEEKLHQYAERRLLDLPGVDIVGRDAPRVPIFSFTVEGIHPHDLGTLLDQEGVAIRTGHHCAQPLLEHLGVHATSRASLAFYNTLEEVDRLANAIATAQEIFR